MGAEREQAAADSWLLRAYYTPVGDVLRGQLSGSLNPDRIIFDSDLPLSVCTLIKRVVRRTRLWRSEQADVARELVAHFADGVAAGQSPRELVESFGPADQAARLIRAGKRRTRPLYWASLVVGYRSLLAGLACGIVAYALLAVRFYWGAPDIARNFWEEINATRMVPEPERAWPLYRRAIAQIGQTDFQLIAEHCRANLTTPEWQRISQPLAQHAAQLAQIRQAASLPALGYLLGDPEDQAFAKANHAQWFLGDSAPAASENQDLLSARLDGLQMMRGVAWLMIADSRRAAAAGDSATTMADLTAQLGMAEQTFQPRTVLVEQIIGSAIFTACCENLGAILHEHPDLFSDAQLRDLAHRLSAFRHGEFALDFSGEFAMFDDLMQRAYTDDGHGDGRLTKAGIRVLQHVGIGAPDQGDHAAHFLVNAASPGLSAIVSSRKENTDFYRSVVYSARAARTGPPWTWDPDAMDAVDDQLTGISKSPIGKLRHVWVQLLAPAVTHSESIMQQAIQRRDATLVALALTLWKHRHGAWPQQLDQLVPDLLPEVPPDRCDGEPLRYLLRDGQPVLYSIGNDGVDDGGIAGPTERAYYRSRDLRNARSRQRNTEALPEDWVLWPAPTPKNGVEGLVESETPEPILAPPGGPSDDPENAP